MAQEQYGRRIICQVIIVSTMIVPTYWNKLDATMKNLKQQLKQNILLVL